VSTVFTTRPELSGDFGMVAGTHWLAAAAGMSVLERGGNAFDAACAAGFTLQVVEPHLNGPAGEAPVLLWSEADQDVRVVCGQGVAPQAATIEAFTALGLDLVPGTGLLAATVPGAFGAWTTLLERWGSWELADVLDYAIGYAERGWPMLPRIAAQLDAVADMFRAQWPTSAATWLPDGAAPAVGGLGRSPGLAATYRRVLAESAGAASREARIAAARRVWYEGFVAEAIDRFCADTTWPDTSGRSHSGLLRGADLAGWQPAVERPTSVDYHGHTVCKTGPWGQGPVLLQQLRLVDALNLAGLAPGSADWIHTIVEAAKLAYADREAWYGDPDASEVPIAALLSAEYAADRCGLVGPAASLELRPGAPDGRTPRLPGPLASTAGPQAAGIGEPTISPIGRVRGDTCHLDVVDRWGNMVSATPSGGWLQSSPAIPDLGFCLGTRAQMFWLEPGLPTSLRPGTRPRTTLSPTLVLRGGEPWLALGTPGGDQQDQWQTALLLSLLHGDAPFQQAIDAPTFHSLHMPSSFYPRRAEPGRLLVESRTDPAVRAELSARGHLVDLADPWSLGRLSLVAREGRRRFAAADPRGGQAYATGR
jgi:gamma-glutamyltranspeptidase/glutathione hydrolase